MGGAGGVGAEALPRPLLPLGWVPSGLPFLTTSAEDSSAIPLVLSACVAVTQVTDGPLSASFVRYRVTVEATWNHRPGGGGGDAPCTTSTSVLRRYSDFDWLYLHLLTTAPNCFIPLLPPKVGAGGWGDVPPGCHLLTPLA